MNPWDNDPVVAPAAPANAAPAVATEPWKSDPVVTASVKPWENDPVVEQKLGPGISLAGTTEGLSTAAALAKGEISQQQNRTGLVGGVPSATNGLPAEGTVYQPNQTLPTQNLPLSQQQAIEDAYAKNYGFMPNPATQRTEAGQEAAQSNAQINQAAVAGNTFGQNASAAFGQTLANVGSGLVGAVAPGAANSLQQNVNANYVAEPGSAGQFVGGVGANLLLAAPSIVAPGLAARGFLPQHAAGTINHLTALTMGGQAFGQVRQDVEQRRKAGQKISTEQELTAAAASALNTIAASKVSQAGMAKFGRQFAPVMEKSLANAVSGYVVNTGIQASDMMVMSAVQNAIKSQSYAPETQGSESAGVAESGVTGGVIGAIGGLATAGAHGGKSEAKAPEAKTESIPAPDLKGVLNEPEAAKQTIEAKPEPTTLPRLLEDQTPKYRVSDEHGNSTGVPLDFENATDKALYLASHPRKGKVSEQAAAWLESQGISREEQQTRAADVRDHVEAHASMHEGGDTLPIPSLENHETSTPAPAESVEAPHPEAKSEEKAYLPSEKAHQEVLDEATPGAKEVPIPEHFSDVVDAAGKIGRTEVVGYSGGKGRGFFHEGRLFLNVDNPQNKTPEGKREVAMHEAAHAAQKSSPELLQRLADAAPESVKAQVRAEYGRLYAKQEGQAASNAVLDRETVPMVVGKLMRSGRAFNEVFQNNRGLLARGVDALLAQVRSLTERGRYHNQILASLKELKARTDHGTVADRSEAAGFLPEHTQRVRDEAEEYARGHNVPYNPDTSYTAVNEGRAKTIAEWYDKAKHEPNSPEVKASYDAMKKETLAQYKFLERKGVKFEPWQGEGQPYANSNEVVKDVRDNKHLAFFTGGDLPVDHPLAERTGIVKNGQELTYNDVFRAVHDYFGHAKEGVGFGPRGEENAWRSHSQMYSGLARAAMSTETRGQNSWVNYGPHGEANRTNPKETRYADQKATLMPEQFRHVERESGPAFLPDEYKPRGKRDKEELAKLKEHLTPEEMETLKPADQKQAVAMLKSLPPDSEFRHAALAGVAMKGWYERSAETLKKTFGPDTEKFVDLLAATSPRQSVVNNLREATKIWAEWTAAGRPTDPQRIEELLKTPVRSGAFNLFGHPETTKLVGLAGRVPNAVRALTGQPLSGPKVTGFAENLQGNYQHTTNDTWMATFGGVDQKEFATPGGYLGYTAKLRDVAKQMGWTPANVQETVWSTMKSLAENVKGGKTGLDALRGMTHEQVAATPAFDNLMGDPSVVKELQRAGLQPPQAAASESGFSGPVISTVTPEHERIAARAEQYATSRGRDVGFNDPEQGQFGTDEDLALPTKPNDEIPFLPGGNAVKSFWNDDVKESASKAGEAVKGAWEGIKRIFAPQTRTHEGLQASETWRTRNAELAQRYDRLNAAFGDARKVLDKAPQAVTRQMIDEVERGVPQTQTHLQPLADAMRSVLDDRLHQVQALGTGKLKQFVEDYFPHLWEDPKKAANVYAEMAAKGPLEGKKGFLKARTLPLFSDGIARGLVPVTENPVEAMMLRTREMDKFITAQQAMQEMDTNGLLRTIKARDPVPPGYAKIDDNIATTFAAPSRRGALQISGYKVAPEAVANVINNQLSPGLRGDKHFGGVFRGFLGAGNLLNSVQLGLSGFHLAMTTMDSATSKLALAFRNVGEGQFGKALGNAGKAATVFGPAIENISRGNKMMKEWFHPGSTDPETAQLVYQMKQAGGRAKMDDFYHAGVAAKMTEAFRKGNYIGAALRAPLAGLELAGKPLMEKLVPRMKMGAFADMAKFELERLGPNASDFEVRRAMTKAWDSVDNRMGQLVYDNLFWNKAAKDLAMASTRSVGWNLGTLRELGGGVLDFSKAGLNLARGRNAEFTHRMAYTAAMPVMAGMIGGMIHYLMTGKHPEELKDWFFPKSGSKDNTGHDVRYALPSYMKDVYAYARNPGETLKNKVHPLVHTIFDMLSNSDYYGAKIHNEDDPIMKQLTDVAKYGGKQLLPFSTREVPKLLSEGQGAKSLLPLIGVTQARKDITFSPAELKASELIHARIPAGMRTQEQADKAKTIGGLAAAFRNKAPTAIDDLTAALKEGTITPQDMQSVRQHVRYTGLNGSVRSLDMHDAMAVWAKASPEEKQTLGSTMFAKLRASRSLTREQKVGYLATLQRDWKSLKAGDVPEGSDE